MTKRHDPNKPLPPKKQQPPKVQQPTSPDKKGGRQPDCGRPESLR